VRVHDNAYMRAAKRLYMTATPRLFDPNTKDKAQDASDAVLASMDDESRTGRCCTGSGFGEAVEKDLLTDYKVLVLTVDEGSVSREFSRGRARDFGRAQA
jgi:predicted helicase